MERECIYLEKFTDEICPAWTLEGWAEWLSRPAEEWGRSAPAKDGERFDASRGVATYHTVAGRLDDGAPRVTPPLPAAYTFIALCWEGASGWDADSISDSLSDLDSSDAPLEVGQVVACFADDPVPYVVTYRADPPRCEIAPAGKDPQDG